MQNSKRKLRYLKLKTSAHKNKKLEQDKDDSKARETQLLNLIVEYNQKDDPYCQHLLHYQDLIYKKAEKLAQLERMSKGIFT